MGNEKRYLKDFSWSLLLCIGMVAFAILVLFWGRHMGEGRRPLKIVPESEKTTENQLVDFHSNKTISERFDGRGGCDTFLPNGSRNPACLLVSSSPSVAPVSPSDVAGDAGIAAHLKEAMAKLDNHEYEAAENLFLEILRLDPSNEKALTELGMIKLINQRDTASAINYFEKVVEVNPSNESILNELVNIYQDAGQLQQGTRFLGELAEKYPSSAIIERSLGRNLANLGRSSEAAVHLRKAAQMASPEHSSESYEELGDLLMESGNAAGALDSYRRSLGAPDMTGEVALPSKQQQRTMLGLKYVHALITLDRRDTAEEVLNKMEQDDPDNEMVIAVRRDFQRSTQGM